MLPSTEHPSIELSLIREAKKCPILPSSVKKLKKTESYIAALKDRTEEEDISIRAEVEGIAQQIFKYRFGLSTSVVLSLVPDDAQVGSLACDLLGCSVPMYCEPSEVTISTPVTCILMDTFVGR
jgi:hypothetical protein